MKHSKQFPGILLLGFGLFLCAAGSAWCADLDSDGLPDEWERGFGRYQIIPGAFTWATAREDAIRRGGHLVTVLNTTEWNDIKVVLGSSLLGKNLWLGGTDEGSEGNWRWITGERWTFTHWRINEPNNDSLGTGQGAPENYLLLWGNETLSIDNNQSYWNDVAITGGVLARDGYILERGTWTDGTDPDTDHDGLLDGQEAPLESSYQVIAQEVSWLQASADAVRRGGHLAAITSESEWRLIEQSLTNLRRPLWIGATDSLQEGVWQWVTGEPFAYNRFSGQLGENPSFDYALAVGNTEGTWDDASLSTSLSAYLLEIEAVLKSDPNQFDSDGDGLNDGEETLVHHTNPLSVDTDGDSLSDFDEVRVAKTNPLASDTDGDGLSDSRELLFYQTDPLRRDTDGDGFSDIEEITLSTNPRDASSSPLVALRQHTAAEIEFDTQVGRVYKIQAQTLNNSWQDIATVSGNGQIYRQLFQTSRFPKGFWRVVYAR